MIDPIRRGVVAPSAYDDTAQRHPPAASCGAVLPMAVHVQYC
jgi:hypothetical protein